MDDAQVWEAGIHRIIEVTSKSWIDEARAERLETLLAWSPSQNLASLLDRLYFRDPHGTPLLSQESSLGQLLLMAVAQKLYQLRRWDEPSLKLVLLSLDDETFLQFIDGQHMSCRSTRHMPRAQRQDIRNLVAHLVLGEPAFDA